MKKTDTIYYDDKLNVIFHDAFEINKICYPLDIEYILNYSEVVENQVNYLNMLIVDFKVPKNIKDLLRMCKIKVHSNENIDILVNILFNKLELIIGQNMIYNSKRMKDIIQMQSDLKLLKTYFNDKGLINFTYAQEDFSKKLEKLVIKDNEYIFKKYCY